MSYVDSRDRRHCFVKADVVITDFVTAKVELDNYISLSEVCVQQLFPILCDVLVFKLLSMRRGAAIDCFV